TPIDDWMFDVESARRSLVEQLRTAGLAGFGLEAHPAAIAASGALVQHLRGMQKADLAHVRAIAYRQRTDTLIIDPTTLKHLEIVEGGEGGRAGSLLDEPPALARDGGFVRDGVDRELDDLRAISRSGKQVIADMETRERARTGIGSLKVRYNRVFGYYIEVSKSNLAAVPSDYHRKQTIAGGERFITPGLKEYEEKVLGADERIIERELEIFEALRAAVATEATRSQATARALAALDVLATLAE